ncbi:pseudouridine synthase [Diaphorobacter caeni]|uniref:pseudouridine synthase n=1 Tax=Diaphorobacter caeni TaxID=2784387 RepID=UPI00188E24F4|nr:pseudouridine synthase [Diaphorobacter caeni]MBF5005379.1 pseudouridine synthase [Diaphorobacter caeni]
MNAPRRNTLHKPTLRKPELRQRNAGFEREPRAKSNEPTRLLCFHKPYGVLSQFTPEGRWRGLKDFIDVPDVYVAGRLDADSEGLLLLTNDGLLQAHISSPKFKMDKTYLIQVEGIPDEAALQRLRDGVQLNDGLTLPAQARRIDTPEWLGQRDPPIRVRQNIPDCWIELIIREGRNRQVRRMTAAIGHPTLRLARVAIGPYALQGIERGQWVDAPPPI